MTATAGRPLARTAPRARTQRARHNREPPAPRHGRIRLLRTELGRRPERAVRTAVRILVSGGDADQALPADGQRETGVSSTDSASKYR
ncbi:hypothetical protein OHA98_41095 [Streptomyces sp. NBC_00654]|uniref:hypothetical protein n=1 Tax=Streptomyces sp. NBC_00654 TaxID=2975799 RepID=UPI00224E68D4|nr:hypothetical protein [Streptomyces sp. NBC_00654]MCX4971013.1 hypothetical protein [Streptomyces sp. NBC_00654]